MQSSAPTTPTKRAGPYRQKEIMTTPRSTQPANKVKGLYTQSDYIRPDNFDDETHFQPNSTLLGQTIQVGNSFFTYGKNMAEYKDSTELYHTKQRDKLLERLELDGYILIRGAIQYDTASIARTTLINHLDGKNAIDTSKHSLNEAYIKDISEDGWTVDAETGGFVNNRESDEAIDGWRKIGWCPEIRNVYNGPDLHSLFRFLWGQERTDTQDGYTALTQNTWLRAKAKGEVTSEHADYYYFKQNTTTFQENRHPYVERDADVWNEENPLPETTKKSDIVICDICLRHFDGTKQIPKAHNWNKDDKGEWHCHDCASQATPFYTCWISLGEYKDENSTLCMMPKTHKLQQFDKPLRTDLLPEDYNDLVKQKWGWLRTSFGLGDIVLFNWKTVHGASKNTMQQFRFSIDTRVCSSWIRPKGLYGDEHRIEYQYPLETGNNDNNKDDAVVVEKDDAKVATTTKITGGIDSTPFLPQCPNQRCPTQLSDIFLKEREVAQKAGIERKRKIGNISSKPKVMGMVSMGSCKPKPMMGMNSTKCNNQDDSDDDDNEDYGSNENDDPNTTLVQLAPRGLKSRTNTTTNKLIKNNKLGADGVGRFGDDDEYCESDTDLSQSQSQQLLTPSRRQHRILRERDALNINNNSIVVESFNLGSIEESNDEQLLQPIQNQLNADDNDKKRKTRYASSQTLESDSDDNNNQNQTESDSEDWVEEKPKRGRKPKAKAATTTKRTRTKQ